MFVYMVKCRPNYTYSSIVTFTAQHEQPFITKFMIFWMKPDLLNDLNASSLGSYRFVVLISTWCAWCLMHRLPF